MVKVFFEDEFLLIIDKPPGLVTTSSETQSALTLEEMLKGEYKINLDRGGIVHRLDKDTSGLMVVGKTKSAVESLQKQFKLRTVEKEYLCLVHGLIAKEGKVEGAIGRNPGDREKFMVFDKLNMPSLEDSSDDADEESVSVNARPAVTIYKPLKLLSMPAKVIDETFSGFNKIQLRKIVNMKYPQFTLVSCRPLTGRTHQIRVHLKYIGFPIVGDSKYGGRKVVRLDHRWCPRQFLHAHKLKIDHPGTGQRMEFESKLPEDLEKALGYLEEANSLNHEA